jgi:hypothetical protein
MTRVFRNELLACIATVLTAGCSPPSQHVDQEPPPRLATQIADLPPEDFLASKLVVTRIGGRKPYCFFMDELLSWLAEAGVHDQQWTQLENPKWRLDGFDPVRREHTVWIFEQTEDGVELVEYKDSDKAHITPDWAMKSYYMHLSHMHSDPVRERYGGCVNPYE